jgi:hypothetical protein
MHFTLASNKKTHILRKGYLARPKIDDEQFLGITISSI